MLSKEVIKRADTYRIISSNNHIINIKKNKSDTSRGSSNKESSVMRTQSETLLSNNWAKLFKPSSRSLLEAIKSTMKATNLMAWVSIARGWLYVHFFLEVPIKESILHIHLIKRPTTNDGHNNETSNKCKASNKSKCFHIVNAIFLSKALSNKASLVSFNRSISLDLDLVNPPTTYYRPTRRQINHIASVIFNFNRHWGLTQGNSQPRTNIWFFCPNLMLHYLTYPYFISNFTSYQNSINERHVCKNNYLLIHVFQLLVG